MELALFSIGATWRKDPASLALRYASTNCTQVELSVRTCQVSTRVCNLLTFLCVKSKRHIQPHKLSAWSVAVGEESICHYLSCLPPRCVVVRSKVRTIVRWYTWFSRSSAWIALHD